MQSGGGSQPSSGWLSRILLPVDFSDRSAGAAQYARALAQRFGSEVVLLHVITPPQYEFGALEIGGSMLVELYRERAQLATAELDSFLKAELAGLSVRRVLREGEPSAQIVEFAREERISLIIMPTHGYGPFRRFILGSNTSKVLHDADCPVWTGIHLEQNPAEPPDNLRHVMCAVDLGAQSSRTLCWAAMLAAEFGARLTLIHSTAAEPDFGDDSEVDWRVDVREAAKREMERLKGFVNVDAEALVETGEPAKAICSAASREGASVLVIGRGSAAGVFGRLRTNAYAIIRQSPCPVVSV